MSLKKKRGLGNGYTLEVNKKHNMAIIWFEDDIIANKPITPSMTMEDIENWSEEQIKEDRNNRENLNGIKYGFFSVEGGVK